MPICEDCSEEFHALETPTCNKCIQLEGKSEIEKVAIRSKQNHNASKPDSNIPRAFLDLPGAFEQIQTFKTSDFTSEIWELVQGHKQTASDTRLGLPRTQNTNLQKTPLGKIQAQNKALEKAVPGIARGMTRVEEMKNKKPYILVQTRYLLLLKKANNRLNCCVRHRTLIILCFTDRGCQWEMSGNNELITALLMKC
ncbi:hypothetical protein B0H17DRAFT_1137928 [Mycena rosella]|uniref:Uncharacterized protein n=1 Tax=Mycena rosella TaxID=1033263 RepID=A0AAD7D7J9_MYCRO|nr:hypothetical protein B0H17DRAFT_1137928 [Mycena rosella]